MRSTPLKQKNGRNEKQMRVLMILIGTYLIVSLAMPLCLMLLKSLQNHDGLFIG